MRIESSLRCHMHVWEHNNPKPENRGDTEKDVCYVYEYVFSHNTSLVTTIVAPKTLGGEGRRNGLVNRLTAQVIWRNSQKSFEAHPWSKGNPDVELMSILLR